MISKIFSAWILTMGFALASFAGEPASDETVRNADLHSAYVSMNYFPVQAYAYVTPHQVQVQIFNNYARPLLCDGWVQATTARGFTQWVHFSMAPTWPGSMGYAWIYAGYGEIFVGAWANAYCQLY